MKKKGNKDFEVYLDPYASRELKKLPEDHQKVIRNSLKLLNKPYSYGSLEKMKGKSKLKNVYKIKILSGIYQNDQGEDIKINELNYRVIFAIEKKLVIILVTDIFDRKRDINVHIIKC